MAKTISYMEELYHTFPLTMSYHLVQFLTGSYSVVKIRYLIQKINENDKNTHF